MLSALLCFATATRFQEPPDPNRLPIGRAGVIRARMGELLELKSGHTVEPSQLARLARGKPYLFLGEQHANKPDQDEEAAIIDALVSSGRRVTVGLEMFTRPKQDVLDQWSQGQLSEADFLEKSDWKHQWGYDYGFYRPVFEVVRKNHLGLVALNIPREWVHIVATSGFKSLPTSARLQLPGELFLNNREHRRVFDSLMGGHAMGGTSMDGMYAAQVLWDSAMADTAAKYQSLHPRSDEDIFVVIAGAGHVMYGQGINYRLKQRKAGEGVSVVMTSAEKAAPMAKGLADFVFVTAPMPGTSSR